MAPKESFKRREMRASRVPSNNAKKKQSKSLKKKIRDTERLLAKPDLPATVRVAQERMLNMMRESLQEKAVQEKELKLVKKYKKVKFFEKRKIMRKFKTCKKELEACSEKERKGLEEQLEEIKKMWNYVVYFPSDMKYISLFPPAPHENLEVQQKQEAILKTIAQKVKSGEIEDASDNILPSSKERKQRSLISWKKVTMGQKQSAAKLSEEDEDDESREAPNQNGLNDDFFIDVKPNKLEEEESNRNAVITHKRNHFSLLGSTSSKASTKSKKRSKNSEESPAKKAKNR